MSDRGEEFMLGDDRRDGMSNGEVTQVVGVQMVAGRKWEVWDVWVVMMVMMIIM